MKKKLQKLARICRKIQCNFVWELGKWLLKTLHQSNPLSRYSHTFASFDINLFLPRALPPYTLHAPTVVVKMLVKCKASGQKPSQSKTFKDNVEKFFKNWAFKTIYYIADTMFKELTP